MGVSPGFSNWGSRYQTSQTTAQDVINLIKCIVKDCLWKKIKQDQLPIPCRLDRYTIWWRLHEPVRTRKHANQRVKFTERDYGLSTSCMQRGLLGLLKLGLQNLLLAVPESINKDLVVLYCNRTHHAVQLKCTLSIKRQTQYQAPILISYHTLDFSRAC